MGSRKFIEIEKVWLVKDDNFTWLPNGTVDLVLTDPPFNIARDTNFHTWEKNTINSFRFDADKGWDSYTPEGFRKLLDVWAKEFSRVLRPGGSFAVFCADEYLSDLIAAMKANGLKPRRTITWRKPNAVPVNRKHMMMSACEYIVMGVKGSKSVFNADLDTNTVSMSDLEIVAVADKASNVMELELRKALSATSARPSVNEIRDIVARTVTLCADLVAERSINIYSDDETLASLCVPNFVVFNSKAGSRLHPTEKPVALLKYLTELFSKPGDLVLDPFAGSASMGEAAMLTGRQAILVEQDEEFFEKGSARLNALALQKSTTLFS